MIKVNLKEAEQRLGQLIEQAVAGQEVAIIDANGSTVRLLPLSQEEGQPQKSHVNAGASREIGHALDRFIGTWSAEQEAEILKAIEVFEQVDETFFSGLSSPGRGVKN
jgi:antitoxin (DNA-binding transcriptional repressor) of toxin-antitoxin stability system